MTLKRECKEEIGCSVKITGDIGTIVEYKKKLKIKQISYCYTAKIIGEKGEPKLEQDEIDEGFETVWFSLDNAIEKVRQSKPIIYEGPYMVARDLAFLEAVKENLKQ